MTLQLQKIRRISLDLPRYTSMENIPLFKATIDQCRFMNPVILNINALKQRTVLFIHRTIMEIFSMIPEYNLKPQNNKSRSLLCVVGSLIKTVFGIATMDDVNILASHIKKGPSNESYFRATRCTIFFFHENCKS